MGLDSKPWSTTRSIEDIFKATFKTAKLPYFNPHSFRSTLTQLGYEVRRGKMKTLKVWSQNLGHEQMMTTYPGYGIIDPVEHGDIMKGHGSESKEIPELGDTRELVSWIIPAVLASCSYELM